MPASETLTHLQRQADPHGVYSLGTHIFQTDEPSLLQNKYVRIQFMGGNCNIDMVHFLVVGPRGEIVGEFLELAQVILDSDSALDPQDYVSNWLGNQFFNAGHPSSYDSSATTTLSAQISRFFESYALGNIIPRGLPGSEQSPEGGVPEVMPEIPEDIRARLTAHESEALSPENFVLFVEKLEAWLQNN